MKRLTLFAASSALIACGLPARPFQPAMELAVRAPPSGCVVVDKNTDERYREKIDEFFLREAGNAQSWKIIRRFPGERCKSVLLYLIEGVSETKMVTPFFVEVPEKNEAFKLIRPE